MKATFSTLIVALLVASAYTQSCNNYGGTFLYAVNMVAYPSISLGAPILPSATPFEVCDEIWRTSGTCCDIAGMKATYIAQMNDIKNRWDYFIGGVQNVKNILSRLQSMSANRSNVKADLTSANAANILLFEGLTPEQGTVLIEKVNDFSSQVAKFAAEAKACFDELIKARGAAFCYGCSANAGHNSYFNANDGKLTISPGSRNAIAAVCIRPWEFINGLGGMMQMFSILNWQKDPSTTAYPQRPWNGPAHAGVTAPQLYDAFIACPNATVGGACTQAIIDQIVVSQFNLFRAEKYATHLNMNYEVTSSYAGRLLAMDSTNVGEVAIGTSTTESADLTIAVIRPPYAGTIKTTSITPQAPVASSGRSSSGNIFVVTSIIMAAVALTLN